MTTTEAPLRRIEQYRQRVEQYPDSAPAHFNLGLAYMRRGLVDRAERHYRKAVELQPHLVEGWVNLGGVLLLKWDFGGSLAANKEALKHGGDQLLAHYNMGQAYLYLGEADGVVRSYRRVVELDPKHAAGHYYLAVGLLAAGRPGEAREELTRARTLGYSPAPEFLRALGAATKGPARSTDSKTETSSAAEAAEKEKED